MKELNNYILEKLHLSKTTKTVYSKFCEGLYLDKNESSRILYDKYFKTDCDNIIGNKLKDDQRLASDFEMIFMICVMLLDDNMGSNKIDFLGYNNYKTKFKGKNNPYDYSWFEEENDNGEDALMIIQQLYQDEKGFEIVYEDMYKLIKDCCNDFHAAIEGIFNFYGEIHY